MLCGVFLVGGGVGGVGDSYFYLKCGCIKFFSSILHRAENCKTLGLANFK
jgi:hypothetical protein